MTNIYDPGPQASPWAKWLKLGACVGIVALLAAAFWLRWIPGRLVPPQWARGGASPDNSLWYESEQDVPASVASDAEALSAPDFTFTMGEGTGAKGYDVIQIWPNGRCEYTYPELRQPIASATTGPATAPSGQPGDVAAFRRAIFGVPPQAVSDLRRLLVEIDYFNLKRSYRAPASATAVAPSGKSDGAPDAAPVISEGTQWFVRVRAGGHEKGVWCDNNFQPQVIKLNDFIRDQIVQPHTDARAQAAPIELPTNWQPDLAIPRSVPDEEPVGD